MSKRILSICLALAILLVALPILPISNTEANAAAPGEANPVFTPSQLPETVVDRAITNFEEADAKVGETNYNGTRYDKNFKAYTYRSGATTVVDSIVDGGFKVEYTAFSTANYPTTHIFIDPALGLNPTTETTALQFHIDTTGMDSASVGTETAFRFTLTTSNGTSGVSDKLFVIDNKTWYFLPDATKENPNPEMITRVTRNTNSVWNAYLDIPNGVKGTVILPIDAFIFDENSKMTNYTKGWTDWEEYITANNTSWRHQSSISLNTRDAVSAGDYFIVDDFKWLKKNPINYQLQTVTQDFETFKPDGNWTWIYGNFSCYGNNPDDALPFTSISAADGRFVVTPAATATTGTRLHLTIDDMGIWKEGYKAFSFDLDVSNQKGAGNVCLRPKIGARKNVDGTLYSTSFAPTGQFYLYNEVTNTIITLPLGDKNTQFTIPEGFKGKVIFFADTFTSYEHKTETGEPYGLHDEVTELALIVEITNWRAEYTGSSYYIDNLTYYTDLEGPDVGYNFATDKVGYESNGVISDTINTVEAWVKTSAASTGTIFSEKYNYPTKNYADGFEAFQIGMNANGNPVVYLSAGDAKGQFVDWTVDTVTINDGKWNHIAVAIDQETKAVKFYLNGVEAASKTFEAFDGVELTRPIVLGHTIDNDATVSNWFDGEIAKVAVFGDTRNAGEVMLDAIQGADNTDENLIAAWELAGSIDNTLKAYDLQITPEDEKYAEYVKDITDGSYTIAILPDTQNVNRNHSDDVSEFDYFNNIYSWIIDNADDYNIKAVLSVGDITDTNDTRVEGVNYEWENARNAFDRLSAAGIPWAVVQGNHDYDNLPGRHSFKFQEYFPMSVYDNVAWDDSQFKLGGSFHIDEFGTTPADKADLSSAYYYLNVDADADYEYMILAIEHEASIGAMEWANQIVQKNSDKKVIIITHGYMDPNGTRGHRTENGLYHDAVLHTDGACGEELWNGVVSQHANIEMILGGHLSCPDIVTRVDKGVNGNDVLQVLMDVQNLELNAETPVAMVGLATYNADGSIVSFKYVSTSGYRTETGEGDYFYDDNSNELKFNLGTVTAPYVDKSVDNSANIEADGLFDGGVIIRDFEDSFTTGTLWWGSSNIDGSKFDFTGRKTKDITAGHFESVPYRWSAGRIKRAPVAQGHTLTFKNLPNFTPIDGETVTAISIHIENPASVTQNFRISLNVPYVSASNMEVRNYDNKYTYSTKIYLVSDDGNVTTTGNSTWATAIPANFSGTMIIPLDNNYCQWSGSKGANNYLYTAEDFRTDVEGNQVTLILNAQGASCETNEFYFDNIAYHTSIGDAFTAPVKDKNGNLIGFEAVKDGAIIDESKYTIDTAPVKYGMKATGWANIDNPIAAAIEGIYPIYEKDTNSKYTITVSEGATVKYPAGQDYALYNDRVVIRASATNAEGKKFAYWTSNGSVFSYAKSISFLAYADASFEAVYTDEVIETESVIFTSGTTTEASDTTKYNMHVTGVVQVPEGTTVKEIGIMLSASEMDAAAIRAGYEANDKSVVKMVANGATVNKQFLYTITGIKKGQTRTALTYYMLSDGTIVYGDTTFTVCVN